jgi:FAD/FMN-containing dehydrogenase
VTAAFGSWGLRGPFAHRICALRDRFEQPDFSGDSHYLAYGNGRSYGDSCLNTGHSLIPTSSFDRYMQFDPVAGTLTCEAGVTLNRILRLIMPQGWFLPVTPGTQFVTVGGAVANDVHGKNHHREGTFGCHVLELELLRSDRGVTRCTSTLNPELFAATIGGLGLTGLITWVRLRLKRISSAMLDGESIKFDSIEEFIALSRDSDASHEYTVAWIDCLSKRGRGLFSRANHSTEGLASFRAPGSLTVPVTSPVSLINRLSVRMMNSFLFAKQLRRSTTERWGFQEFFYPLDGILHWNRLYGPKGFFQYQCALPMAVAPAALHEILRLIRGSNQGSFLAVLKVFGEVASPGLLSFPRPGVTLAIDFPNAGPRTARLLGELERVTAEADGAIYPAKDANMSPRMFARSFARVSRFSEHLDPKFSSTFWRRVTS